MTPGQLEAIERRLNGATGVSPYPFGDMQQLVDAVKLSQSKLPRTNGGPMRSYHIVTPDGERDVKADNVNITATGALQLTNANGELVVCYAAGAWTSIEVEARDDRAGKEDPELAHESHGRGKGGKK